MEHTELEKQVLKSQKLMAETPIEFGGTGESLKSALEENYQLRKLLTKCEEYVIAYKCQVNPISSREDASKLLKKISKLVTKENKE